MSYEELMAKMKALRESRHAYSEAAASGKRTRRKPAADKVEKITKKAAAMSDEEKARLIKLLEGGG